MCRIFMCVFFTVSLLCGYCLNAQAEDMDGGILGMGVLYSTKPYIEVDEKIYPVPIVAGKYKKLYADGTSAGYIFNDNEQLEFSAVLKPRFMGYDSDEGTFLDGMEDRDWSIDGGLRGIWRNEYFDLNVTGLTDLLCKHEGHEFSAVFSKKLFGGIFIPRVGIKWMSDDLIDYYYGVKPTEINASRVAYEPGAAFDFVAGFTVCVPLGEQWVLVGDFQYEGLDSEIQDSPIVDAGDVLSCIAGLAYKF